MLRMSLWTKDAIRKFTKEVLAAKMWKMFTFASCQRPANGNNSETGFPAIRATVLEEEERASGARGSGPQRSPGLSLQGPPLCRGSLRRTLKTVHSPLHSNASARDVSLENNHK